MDQIRPWLCIRQVVVRVVSPQDIAEASGSEGLFPLAAPHAAAAVGRRRRRDEPLIWIKHKRDERPHTSLVDLC